MVRFHSAARLAAAMFFLFALSIPSPANAQRQIDWREEVIWRASDNRELRIYSTTIPTNHRLTTLMQDPQYRLSVVSQNVAYNQPPQPGFFLGDGITPR